MSTRYHVACLSHDPALLIEGDGVWEHDREAALDAARHPASPPLEGHRECDLLVVASSGGPTEVACPGGGGQRGCASPHAPCYHMGAQWAAVRHLRLLWHGQRAEPGSPLRADADTAERCWTPERVHRLRRTLSVTEAGGGR